MHVWGSRRCFHQPEPKEPFTYVIVERGLPVETLAGRTILLRLSRDFGRGDGGQQRDDQGELDWENTGTVGESRATRSRTDRDAKPKNATTVSTKHAHINEWVMDTLP